MQNDDLPEPLGPLTKQENGCLNLRWSLVENSLNIDLRMTLRGVNLSYLYPNGSDVLSCSRRLLKKEILYNLSSGSVIIETTPPLAFLLRLIFFSVCLVTCSVPVFPKIMSLMTSKLTSYEALKFNVIPLTLLNVFRSPVTQSTFL